MEIDWQKLVERLEGVPGEQWTVHSDRYSYDGRFYSFILPTRERIILEATTFDVKLSFYSTPIRHSFIRNDAGWRFLVAKRRGQHIETATLKPDSLIVRAYALYQKVASCYNACAAQSEAKQK